MAITLDDDYTALLHQLLPRGPAWGGQHPLLHGLAPSLAAVHRRATDLMAESYPQTTTELIDRYEILCGLPDPCDCMENQTLLQRQQRLDAKMNVPGGINQHFYLHSLTALGYPEATITQYQHDAARRYDWQVNLPQTTTRWQTCTSSCHAALRTWGEKRVECVLNTLCPSHTRLTFSYQGALNASD